MTCNVLHMSFGLIIRGSCESVDICEFTASKMNSEWVVVSIGPIHKGVSLFLLDTTKVNSLHHMKEYPKISNLP